MKTRAPVVAGLFYPREPAALRRAIQEHLKRAPGTDPHLPRALIVPHAGYVYSGPVAAHAYARLAGLRDQVRTVVLIGPAHYLPVAGVAASTAAAFTTPFGDVRVDALATARVCTSAEVHYDDAAHEPEHCIEVQLPFLQEVLSEFAVVPLLTGSGAEDVVARALEVLWPDAGTLFIVSSDLSHHLTYDAARKRDRATAEAIEQLQPERITATDACGRHAVCGLLRLARAHGLTAQRLDLRNSGDTAGPLDRVVGYGAFAFF